MRPLLLHPLPQGVHPPTVSEYDGSVTVSQLPAACEPGGTEREGAASAPDEPSHAGGQQGAWFISVPCPALCRSTAAWAACSLTTWMRRQRGMMWSRWAAAERGRLFGHAVDAVISGFGVGSGGRLTRLWLLCRASSAPSPRPAASGMAPGAALGDAPLCSAGHALFSAKPVLNISPQLQAQHTHFSAKPVLNMTPQLHAPLCSLCGM